LPFSLVNPVALIILFRHLQVFERK